MVALLGMPLAVVAQPVKKPVLCIENTPVEDIALQGQLKDRLADLANTLEAYFDYRVAEKCADVSADFRLMALKIRTIGKNLVLSGKFDRPSLPGQKESMPKDRSVWCEGCADEDKKVGVQHALGLFLNDTIFDWRLSWKMRLLGPLAIEECVCQSSQGIDTTLKLEASYPVQLAVGNSYALLQTGFLPAKSGQPIPYVSRNQPYFLDLIASEPGAASQTFRAQLVWVDSYEDKAMLGKVGERICAKPLRNQRNVLLPIYYVGKDVVNRSWDEILQGIAGPAPSLAAHSTFEETRR